MDQQKTDAPRNQIIQEDTRIDITDKKSTITINNENNFNELSDFKQPKNFMKTRVFKHGVNKCDCPKYKSFMILGCIALGLGISILSILIFNFWYSKFYPGYKIFNFYKEKVLFKETECSYTN